MMRSLRSALMLLSVGRLLGVAVAQGSGRCNRAALTGAWSSQGRTYITAPSGAQDCSTVGDGTCHATQILDYTACQIAQDACFSASGAQGDDGDYCPWGTIGHLGAPETSGGPRGCHVQDGSNWQFNENGVAGSAWGHSPVCLLEGSADLDPDAVATGSSFPCCSDCMDGCGGWPASDECHDDAHTSADGHGICDCDGRCEDVIPGYRGDMVQPCLRVCDSDFILSDNGRCPRGYSFPTTAEACGEAAAAVGHPLSAQVQETCDRDPCTAADVEEAWGSPICSTMPSENYRVMFSTQGTRDIEIEEDWARDYFKAICVAGGDVEWNDDCACVGQADPVIRMGASCEGKDNDGDGIDDEAWCWVEPGTCSDGYPAAALGIPGLEQFPYEASTQACEEMNSHSEDCDPADIYELLMPCMSAMADPANFCSSACFEALVPWVDQCYGLIDSGIQALFNPILSFMRTCPEPPSREEDKDAPCCQTCQDGCGGYMSATGDYGAGSIAPECLDARHTRTVRGEIMGVCDSDGQTPFDGEPCRRDCDEACEAIGGIDRVLIGCQEDYPNDDDASFDEICANSCVQNLITCKNSPVLAEDALEIQSYEHACGDAANGGYAGDQECSLAIIQTACAEADEQYGEGWGPSTVPNFCDVPCIKEVMDCQEDPRLSSDLYGVDCTNVPPECHPCVDFAPCLDGQPALNGHDCGSAPPECAGCADYVPCFQDLAFVFATCGSDPCSSITEDILPSLNTVCCQHVGDCSEDGSPIRCSQACAELYLPFWQQCGDFLGGAAALNNLQQVSEMCAATDPDLAAATSSGYCTLSQTASTKCGGTCVHEGSHDQDECESGTGRRCCTWVAGAGGGH